MIPLKSTIYILGSGGFANEVATYIRETVTSTQSRRVTPFSSRSVIGPLPDHLQVDLDIFFVDDNAAGDQILSVKDYRSKFSSVTIKPRFSIMGSGQCNIKKKMQKEILEPFISLKHFNSVISPSAEIGKGSVITPGSVIAARARLGEHVLANYNCKIGHDSEIGKLSTISPGAFIGGFCKIGDSVHVGANASIKENIVIGNNSIIAMGSVIVNNIPPDSIAVGVPAMVFPLDKWDIIKLQLSSNIQDEQKRLTKNINTL